MGRPSKGDNSEDGHENSQGANMSVIRPAFT